MRHLASARRAVRLAIAAAAAVIATAAPAGADIVTLANGRTLSVSAVHFEGGDAVLTLRAGGEIRCPTALVAAVVPDEMPPDTAPAPPGAPAPAVVDDGPPVDLSTRPYAPLIASLAERHGLEPRLVHAVVQVESGYAARARSKKGARGLMQVMPATGRQYGARNLYEPASNLDVGMRHLKALLARFDVPLALAAYNAGEAAVRRFGGIPPFAETQAYVRRVLRLAGLARPAAAAASVSAGQ